MRKLVCDIGNAGRWLLTLAFLLKGALNKFMSWMMSLLLLFVGSYLCSDFFNTFLVFFINCFSACCAIYSLFSPSCPECAKVTVADIVFLVDGSSSIGIDNFKSAREFLKSVVTGLDIGPDKVRIGLAQYSDEPHQEFLLKDHMDKSSLLTALDEFPYRTGNTATGKAMKFLVTRYFTEDAGSRAKERVPQIAVIITDGDSGDDVVAPAKSLRQHGVIVFGIGVGQANLTELKAIANRPSERFLLTIDNYQALQRLTDGLLQTVCISVEDQRQGEGKANRTHSYTVIYLILIRYKNQRKQANIYLLKCT